MWPWAKAALPQFWSLQPAWSLAEPSQAEPSAHAAPGAMKTQTPVALVPWYLSLGALCRVNAARALLG